MKFKEFLDKIEKEYFIDGEQNEEFCITCRPNLKLFLEESYSQILSSHPQKNI